MPTEQSPERSGRSESTISLRSPSGSTERNGGKASRAQHCRFFLPRLPNVRCTAGRRRTTSVRFEYWKKPGSAASAWTAASQPVAVRRSRKRSCASIEGEPRGTDEFRLATASEALRQPHAPRPDPRQRSSDHAEADSDGVQL